MTETSDTTKLHHPTMRVIAIFEAIYHSKNGLTLAEISRVTGISKGTLHPIVLTLLHEHYLQYEGTRIEIGKNCFKLGYTYVHSLNYLDILKPHMREIVASCDEICQLGILDGGDVLYVEKTEPDQAIRIESSAGKTVGAYATALGKCLLSGFNDDEVRRLYEEPFTSYTPYTTTDLPVLLKQLDMVRRNGYSHEIGETNKDVECVAVPVHNGRDVMASISVSLPRFRSTPEKIEQIAALLKQHAQSIENEIALLPSGLKLYAD